MGMAKLDHIATIVAMPDVAAAWTAKFGQRYQPEDIEAMYAEFLPLQKKTLDQHCRIIEGVPQAVEQLRARGLKISSSAGYTRIDGSRYYGDENSGLPA